MFKDTKNFEDTSKNVFLNKRPSNKAPEAAEANEAAKASPEGLKNEAKDGIKAIEKDLRQIEGRYKLKLDRKDAYGSEKALEHYDKSLKDAVVSLVKGMQEFQEIAKSKTPSRTLLDVAHLSLNSGRTALKAHFALTSAEYDPMAFQEEHAYNDVSKAEKMPSKMESVEISDWLQIAKAAEELALLDKGNPANKKRIKVLRTELTKLAKEQFVGEKGFTITKENMKIEKAKGPGSPAFKITLEFRHENEQGTKGAKRVETVYSLNSGKNDFETS